MTRYSHTPKYLNFETIVCAGCRQPFNWDGKDATNWRCGICSQLRELRQMVQRIEHTTGSTPINKPLVGPCKFPGDFCVRSLDTGECMCSSPSKVISHE